VLDPKVLTSTLPGLLRLDTIGDHEYEGALETKLGSVQADFQGTLELRDLKPPSSYRFSLNGMGASGLVDGDGVLVLEESGGGTRIHYELDAKVGGRLAGVGEGVFEASVKMMAKQTLEALEGHFPRGASVRVVTRQEAAVPVPVAAPTEEEAAAPAAIEPEKAEAGAAPEAAVVPATEGVASDPDASQSDEEPSPPDPTPSESEAASSETAPEPSRPVQYGSKAAKSRSLEFLHGDKRPWLFTGALIVYTLVVVLLTRACSG